MSPILALVAQGCDLDSGRSACGGAADTRPTEAGSKVGEITMDNELLSAKIEALEGKRPLAHRRSRR
jgi:hypothetical protein